MAAKFSVTKSSEALIFPCHRTPSHTLVLSPMDAVHNPGPVAESFLVYKHGRNAAEVIRQALGKALVSYYPLAGRLQRTEEAGVLQVDCSGDGVWLVQASADCSLDELGWLEHRPLLIPKEELLPSHPDPTGMSLMLQVTSFTCDGFLLGIKIDHRMMDGVGVGQILNAVADIARGAELPRVQPVWLRECLGSCPPPPAPSQDPKDEMYHKFFACDVSQQHINQIKDKCAEQTGRRCSAFEAAAAVLWQCRTRAMDLQDPSVDTNLAFIVNLRRVLPNGGAGYYGNCIHPATATAAAGRVVAASLSEIVTLIRDAKETMSAELSKWVEGDNDVPEEDDRRVRVVGYESMLVLDWRNMGFAQVDFGFGGPDYFTPGEILAEMWRLPMCYLLKSRARPGGIRVITACAKDEHLKAFKDQLSCYS